MGRLHRDGRPAVLPWFNPVTQDETYDPDAEYVKRYVPELSEVPADRVHGWTAMTDGERRGTCDDYPHPIVDHDEAREAAIAMFERARGEGGE